MKVLKFRPAACNDLDGIWEYSAGQWGTDQAETYLRRVQAVCLNLCDETALSQSAHQVLVDCRKAIAGSHVIYFRESADEIIVIRILHQRMDVPRHI